MLTTLSCVIGRLIALFRAEYGLSQAEFGAPIGYDRSLVARLEVGRNIINVDNIHDVEHLLVEGGLLARPGDLLLLGNRVALELHRRGYRVMTGKAEDHVGQELLDLSILDRVVASIADSYLQAEELPPPSSPKPVQPRRQR